MKKHPTVADLRQPIQETQSLPLERRQRLFRRFQDQPADSPIGQSIRRLGLAALRDTFHCEPRPAKILGNSPFP
jgi:hypothetical protein